MENSNKEIAKTKEKSNELDYFMPFFDSFFHYPAFSHEFSEMEKIMKTDVSETENEITFEMELPGFKKEDILIELKNGYLIISAEKRSNGDLKSKKHLRQERYYGNFSRSFYIGDIERSEINAELDSGVLSIHVPKKDKNERQNRIEIK